MQVRPLQRYRHLVADAVQDLQFVVVEQSLVRPDQVHHAQRPVAEPQRNAGVVAQPARVAFCLAEPFAFHDVGDVVEFAGDEAAAAGAIALHGAGRLECRRQVARGGQPEAGLTFPQGNPAGLDPGQFQRALQRHFRHLPFADRLIEALRDAVQRR